MRSLKGLCCVLLCALALGLCFYLPRRASAANFTVNSLADTPDASTADGLCADANGNCTLRAAIQQANADPPGDVIGFGVNGTIKLTGTLPDIANNMTVNGPGADELTVRRDTGGDYRVFTIKTGVTVSLSGLTVSNGFAPDNPSGANNGGGGIRNSGTLTLMNCTVSGNATADASSNSSAPAGSGGGIFNQGTLTMMGCTVSNNTTGKGGANGPSGFGGGGAGIANSAVLSMTNCTVSNNTTGNGGDATPNGGQGGGGGGIANFNDGVHTGVATLTNCTVGSNHTGRGGTAQGGSGSGGGSGGFGGGIVNFTTMTITNSAVNNNSTGSGADAVPGVPATAGSGGSGGGIFNGGSLTITNSVIAGNVTGNGGVGNDVTCGQGNGGDGGGIASPFGSTLKLSQSDILSNQTGNFGGICGRDGNGGGLFGAGRIRSNIIALNFSRFSTSGSDYFSQDPGEFESLGYNYIGHRCCLASTDRTGLGPGLDSATLIPLPGSRVIDGGLARDIDDQPVTTDRRGAPRPFDDPTVPPEAGGDNSDIGAFERQSTDPQPPRAGPSTFVTFNSPSTNVTEGCVQASVSVTRSGPLDGTSDVTYAVFDKTATQRGDFTLTTGRLTFNVGEAFKSIPVLISEDAYAEGPEELTVTLTSIDGGTLGLGSSIVVQIDDNDSVDGTTNPIDDNATFVGQHYHDFLSRQADAGGQAFWTNQLASCGSDAACLDAKRVDVSAAFFLSIEFQNTGYYVIRVNKVAFGDRPENPRYLSFLEETQEVDRGVIVGQLGFESVLEANKQSYAGEIVASPDFQSAHGNQSATQYVDSLFANAGVTPTQGERDAAINAFGSGDAAGRASSLRSVVESGSVYNKLYNPAFVLMQYFAYLRRNPDNPPDNNFDGYNFWLSKLNQFTRPGEDARDESVALARVRRAEMIRAFLLSSEYRGRFQGDPNRGSQFGSVAKLAGVPDALGVGLPAARFGPLLIRPQ